MSSTTRSPSAGSSSASSGRKGFAVEVAADGEAALALLRGRAFDVILLDIVMPGLDGLATMKRLRQDPAAPAIIVLTGRATVETAVEAMKNGAFDYLTLGGTGFLRCCARGTCCSSPVARRIRGRPTPIIACRCFAI